MSRFDQEEFNEFVVNENIVGVFEKPIKLKSGRTSNWYVNWRNGTEDVFLADCLTDFVIGKAADLGLNPTTFYGVPEGATKLGILTQYKWALEQKDFAKGVYPLPMGRGKPKEHGAAKDKYFVGEPRGRVVVLEDVTTTGGSLLETVSALKELNVEIIAAIGLTNRMERTPIAGVDSAEVFQKYTGIYEKATGMKYEGGLSVEAALKNAGVKYHALTDALQILPQVAEKVGLSYELRGEIEKEFDNFGTGKIRWV